MTRSEIFVPIDFSDKQGEGKRPTAKSRHSDSILHGPLVAVEYARITRVAVKRLLLVKRTADEEVYARVGHACFFSRLGRLLFAVCYFRGCDFFRRGEQNSRRGGDFVLLDFARPCGDPYLA